MLRHFSLAPGVIGLPAMTLDVPLEWAALADRLASSSWRRLVVLGRTDVGKSSFLHFLAHALTARGQTVALLDTDLGQKMVGPPACVVLALASDDGELREERIRFVGETSPAANMAGVIAASARLAAGASADRLLVNTSGLIAGPGIALKRWKMEALQPDHIVALARGDELAPVVALVMATAVHWIQPSPMARRKTPAQRERNRADALLKALGVRCRLPSPDLQVEDLRRGPVPPDALRLCGLADERGEDVGLGLVRWTDRVEHRVVWTGLAPQRLHRIRLGMPLAEFGNLCGAISQED
jgi:polynucleotide 5'-hydroxyl-kinase GRC3/NOL9